MSAGRAGRIGRTGVVGLVAAAVAVTAFTVPAQARTESGGTAGEEREATQRALDALVKAGMPGVTAGVRDKDGFWQGTAGVRDLNTGAPRGANDRFRIGSVTKTFVSTVLLQMEAEGRLSLDDSVEKWLPGVVRGNGNDGRRITVRQLLNHSSGLFNYTSDPEFARKNLTAPGFLTHRYDTHAPLDLVKVGLAHRPDFAPGTRHSYSNTGYILAGLIIEKISGKTYESEVRERILQPLGLRSTSLPENDPRLPRPSARNYSGLGDQSATELYDVTAHNMSWGWAAGDMISTTKDLNRFLSSLMRGKLFPKKQLNAMKTTIPTPDDQLYSGYGLGIYTVRNSCDATLWSHSGGTPGAVTEAVTTGDGRHTVAYNVNSEGMGGVVDAEFCQDPAPAPRTAVPLL
ncbi:serine hydrolase domain-containing protein [Streptomyces sp. NPDC020141]|uniref:serine hydrolase domain-containing protein n=1 Tax=Streptomyces sp. NPDC020141 TaxID=3365065 RepID=UPI003794610D